MAERDGLDGEALVRTSRLTARMDNNAIADGFQIYLHTFIVSAAGEWAVVQQGMNERTAAGAPLSLAFGHGSRFHLRAAHGDRRRAPGDHSEPGGRTRASRRSKRCWRSRASGRSARSAEVRANWRCRGITTCAPKTWT